MKYFLFFLREAIKANLNNYLKWNQMEIWCHCMWGLIQDTSRLLYPNSKQRYILLLFILFLFLYNNEGDSVVLFRTQYFNSQVKTFIIKFIYKDNNIGIIKSINKNNKVFINQSIIKTTYTLITWITQLNKGRQAIWKVLLHNLQIKGTLSGRPWLKNQI